MHQDRSADPVEAQSWLRALFDESPAAIAFSRDGLMLDANPTYARLFGHESAVELRGRSLLEQIAPSHRAHIIEMITQRARGEPLPTRYQSRGRRKDGSEFPFEITTTRVVVADGPLTIAFITDVTERVAAVDALKASEERFRTLSGAAFEGVFVHAEGKILLANQAGAAMYGFDPASMVGASLMDLTAPESRPIVLEHLRSGATDPYEATARRLDGTTFVVEVRGRTLSLQGRPTRVTVIRDITERKRAEVEQRALGERVRQAQKLESLGVLAGGVAHDFNNILTVIINEAALARRETGVGAAPLAHLESITLAARRAADLCRQMLAYAGQARLEREPVDLGALVAEMASMLEASISKRAAFSRALAPALPPLLGDATQLRQVVMNLVINASEAVSGPNGTIRVTTGVGELDAATLARARGDAKPGPHVRTDLAAHRRSPDARRRRVGPSRGASGRRPLASCHQCIRRHVDRRREPGTTARAARARGRRVRRRWEDRSRAPSVEATPRGTPSLTSTDPFLPRLAQRGAF